MALNISAKCKKFFTRLVLPALILLSTPQFLYSAYAGAGHDLPPSSIGDRLAYMEFQSDPRMPSASDKVTISYSFLDNSTGENIKHVTYVITITDPNGTKVFSEFLHGHDGKLNIQFKPTQDSRYTVNANYDNLAASYVADYAGTIAVTGPVFTTPGTYRVDAEVNGVDYDNTFLPEPLEYGFSLVVAESQEFAAKYEDTSFAITVMSPAPVSSVELRPESKQLLVKYPGGEWQHFDDFEVYVVFPEQMMSGPFSAEFNGMALKVSEEKQAGGMTRLALNGTHLDVMQMNPMEGMSDDTAQNSIVLTAATVIPEFSVGFAIVASALFVAALLLLTRLGSPLTFARRRRAGF